VISLPWSELNPAADAVKGVTVDSESRDLVIRLDENEWRK
jgi:hypothetical protein